MDGFKDLMDSLDVAQEYEDIAVGLATLLSDRVFDLSVHISRVFFLAGYCASDVHLNPSASLIL